MQNQPLVNSRYSWFAVKAVVVRQVYGHWHMETLLVFQVTP